MAPVQLNFHCNFDYNDKQVTGYFHVFPSHIIGKQKTQMTCKFIIVAMQCVKYNYIWHILFHSHCKHFKWDKCLKCILYRFDIKLAHFVVTCQASCWTRERERKRKTKKNSVSLRSICSVLFAHCCLHIMEQIFKVAVIVIVMNKSAFTLWCFAAWTLWDKISI